MASSVTTGESDFVAMMWPSKMRFRSLSEESMGGKVRVLMMLPRGPLEVA